MPRRKTYTISQLKEKETNRVMNAIARMTSFYRANPHRFVKDYLGIELKLFQKFIIYLMNWANFFILFSSRGLGKTFITAVFCCVRCILYPGTKICVAASTRSQGNQVLGKIQDLRKISHNLDYEIQGDIKISANVGECVFKNGSWIRVVTASDSARGNRANIIFVDEFIKTDEKAIIDVLQKFLTAPRHPKFMDLPEYTDYPAERNKEIYASSAGLKSHWSFKKLKAYVSQMVLRPDRRYFACALPYQIAIKEGLLSREQVEDKMSEDDFDELSWSQEMECMFFGDTEESFFKFDDLSDCRKIKTALPSLKDVMDGKEKVPPLAKDERRILSLDIALMASTKHNNDASSAMINRALPDKDYHYTSNYLMIDSYEGLTTEELGIIIMRLFYYYKCTDLVLDTNGIGISIFDYISQDHFDVETGNMYGALTTVDARDPMAARCKNRNAKRCVWSIKATASFNNDIAVQLRNDFSVGKINLLTDEYTAEKNMLEHIPKYRKYSSEQRVDAKMPFVQTTLLVNELISLKYEVNGLNIKLKEQSGMRKDRYSSIAYNNYVTNIISKTEHDKHITNDDLFGDHLLLFKKPVIRKI